VYLSGAPVQSAKLKSGAVPSQFSWMKAPSKVACARKARLQLRSARISAAVVNLMPVAEEEETFIVSVSDDEQTVATVEIDSNNVCGQVDVGIQTDNEQSLLKPAVVSSDTQTDIGNCVLSIDNFVVDERGLQFYTGLDNHTTFLTVLSSLGPAAYHLNYLYDKNPSLSVPNQLFLTLVKLRTYKTNFELSRLFNISEAEVYIVFVTWIKFMGLQWREINVWPVREVVDFFAPIDFREKFHSTRVIVDGTEIPIKVPKVPAAQQITFSNYKNRNTAKALIGITPGGLVSFISDAYGGSASDRQIVERTNLRAITDPGDSVMADKGFDVQDLFAPVDVTVNIPTFFKKRNRFGHKTVLRDRKIASKRVHVERAIGLAKTYKILTHALNHTDSVLSSDIVFVCFMLTNFRRCIVPRHA